MWNLQADGGATGLGGSPRRTTRPRRCRGGYCASGADRLRVYADGRPFTGDPRVLPLAPHAEIVVAFGQATQLPRPTPSAYAFPEGL